MMAAINILLSDPSFIPEEEPQGVHSSGVRKVGFVRAGRDRGCWCGALQQHRFPGENHARQHLRRQVHARRGVFGEIMASTSENDRRT